MTCVYIRMCVCVCARAQGTMYIRHTEEDESEEDEDEEGYFFSVLLAKLLSIHEARNRAVRLVMLYSTSMYVCVVCPGYRFSVDVAR